jgi:hypothetical protein
MARRTNYVRDASGRFSSTPGGASGLGASRKARSPGAKRKSGAMTGGTLAARSSLKASRAKAAASFTPSPQQRGAVTRANRKLTATQAQSRRTGLNAAPGVIRGKAGQQAKRLAQKERSRAGLAAMTAAKKAKTTDANLNAYGKGVKQRGAKMLRDFQASGKKTAPKSTAPTKAAKVTKSSPQADAKARAMAERQARARKIKEMVNRTGVVKGKNFNDGKDVSTMSMAEMRRAVRQELKRTGIETKKEFRFALQQDPPKTRSGWERIYKEFIKAPMSERNRKARPGVINGIDIQKNFRPWAVFGLNPKTATRADVQSAYRRVAKQVHPDLGGRAKDLERVTKMRDSVLAMMETGSKPKGRKAKATATASASPVRSRGPLLLMPAKSSPRRRKPKT